MKEVTTGLPQERRGGGGTGGAFLSTVGVLNRLPTDRVNLWSGVPVERRRKKKRGRRGVITDRKVEGEAGDPYICETGGFP